MRLKILLILLCIMVSGCTDEPDTWTKEVESKVVDISFVGSGGYGSPNAVRIWQLENGMMVTMCDWKQEDVCIGDVVVRYRSSKYKNRRWQKKK